MIFDYKKDTDTTNVYNAIIKVIENRAPDINEVFADGVSHLVVYRLEGDVDLELHGYSVSFLGNTRFVLQRVSFDTIPLQRNVFTDEKIADLNDRFEILMRSGSRKINHFAYVDKLAQDILNNIK